MCAELLPPGVNQTAVNNNDDNNNPGDAALMLQFGLQMTNTGVTSKFMDGKHIRWTELCPVRRLLNVHRLVEELSHNHNASSIDDTQTLPISVESQENEERQTFLPVGGRRMDTEVFYLTTLLVARFISRWG
jgi:hypothetical protein